MNNKIKASLITFGIMAIFVMIVWFFALFPYFGVFVAFASVFCLMGYMIYDFVIEILNKNDKQRR